MTLIELLGHARAARLRLSRGEEGALRIRGPRSAEALVRQLLDRKEAVLATVSVYNGTAERLDWRREPILADMQPCALCGRPSLLIEPYDKRPCHKTCAEAAIRWGTGRAATAGRAA